MVMVVVLLFRAAKIFLTYGMSKPIHFLRNMQVSF